MSEFRILSLDGGGIRGAFAASFLAELEQQVGKPLVEHFDLIAGTSTGGIIAVALALGEPAAEILRFYETKGPLIFSRRPSRRLGPAGRVFRWWFNRRLAKHGLDYDSLFASKYDGHALALALQEVFENRTLEDARTRVVIPAVDLCAGKPVVFKTPHLADAASRDRHFSAVEIVQSTTAAPTYLPHAVIRPGSAYADGGLWANNPSAVAIAEAVKILATGTERLSEAESVQRVRLLSVGTGRARASLIPPGDAAGLGWWGPRIVDVMSWSQGVGTEKIAHHLLRDRQHRIDFDLPDESWKLDCIEHIGRLVHFGREAAHAEVSILAPMFFREAVTRFAPVGERGRLSGAMNSVDAGTKRKFTKMTHLTEN